jgi:hypothetical protein
VTFFLYVINANVGHSDDNSVFNIVIVIDIRAKKWGGGQEKVNSLKIEKLYILTYFNKYVKVSD